MEIQKILKNLAALEEPEGTVVTLALDLAGTGALPPGTRVFMNQTVASYLSSEARPEKLRSALRKIERKIRDYVETGLQPGTKGLYLVAGRGVWQPVELKVPLKNFIIVGKKAYLAPLLATESRHPRAYVVEVNSNEVVLHELHLGESQKLRTIGGDWVKQSQQRLRSSRSKAHLSTGPGGGGSARDRQQQRKEESGRSLSHEASEAVKELHAIHPAEAVYLVGPQDAFGEFSSRLSQELGKRTVALGARDQDVAERAVHELKAHVDGRFHHAVQEFTEGRAQGLQAALGPRDVLESLYSGKVERIYLDEYDPIPGIVCTSCGAREPGLRSKCPFCSEEVTATSITQDVVAHSLAHPSVALTFVGSEAGWLRDLGGMAALLSVKGARRRTTPAIK
jgi:hypothetical protein